MRVRSCRVGYVLCLLLLSSGGLIVQGAEPKAIDRPGIGSSALLPPAKIALETHKSIDRGLKWLLAAQRKDGMLGPDVGHPPDLGCTAIVGLALLAEGNTCNAGPHHDELRRLLDGVLNRLDRLLPENLESRPNTLIQRKIGRNADLFLAALFLSQLLGDAPDYDADIRATLEELVLQICQTQQADGTWGEESWAPVLGTVLGWESLRAASSCGLRVAASDDLAGKALFAKLRTGASDRDGWMHKLYKEASCIRVLYSLKYREDPLFKESVNRLLTIAKEDNRPFIHAGGEEYLAFYLVTECLLQQRHTNWAEWYPAVSGRLVRIQNEDGSWTGHHCITSRTFCTAAVLLTLQAPNICIPISDL